MARPLRIEYPGAFYHVTSRGNQKQQIFMSDSDQLFFIDLMRRAHEKFGAVFHTFCLMTNHFHFLLETPRGNLAKIMHFINASYCGYFNNIHAKVGHVFQGRYAAILVEKETYALGLSRYIHLNPVRANIVEAPEEYLWSSYREFMSYRSSPDWLKTELVLGYYSRNLDAARSRYRKFVLEGIGIELEDPIKKAGPSLILGSEAFIDRIKERYFPKVESQRDIPALRALKSKPALETICLFVAQQFGEESKLTKKVAIYLCRKRTDYCLQELARYFEVSQSSISMTCTRFKAVLSWNAALKKTIDEIEDSIFDYGVRSTHFTK